MNHIQEILLIFFLWLYGIVAAQELPPVNVYLPEDYKGETQNWSISQAANKYIYVANNEGLLEFNGANWSLYPTPNGTVMRSVKVVDDRIYTGFYMNFGYWKKNDLGKLVYTSLSDAIKDQLIEDEQYWYIENHNNWVLFQSLSRIYVYNTINEEITRITSEIAMLNMFNVNGVIFYQEVGRGIYKVEKGKPVLVTDFSVAAYDKIVNITKTEDGILIITSKNGFFELINNRIRKWDIAANKILDTISVYSALQLEDKSFVLGTISNGLIYLSPKGDVVYEINKSKGLTNNTILSLLEDVDGNVWLGLDDGINCINIRSPIKIFNDEKGTIGTTYTSIIYNGFLYLGTNQGVFYRKLNIGDQFSFIEGTKGQAWSLFTYDNSLFCGHDSGTFLIQNNKARLVSTNGGTWTFKTIPNHPDLLLQGTYIGLSLLEKNNGNWNFKREIEGFDYSARFLEIYNDQIWINHEYKGVFKVKLDEQLSKVISVKKDTVMTKGKSSGLLIYEGSLLYTHQGGAFSFDKTTNTFGEEDIMSKTITQGEYDKGKIITDNTGGLWSFSEDDLAYISQSQFSDDLKAIKIPVPRSMRKEKIGYENILHVQDDEYLLGTANGYKIFDLSRINSEEYVVLLDQVLVKDKYTEFKKVPLFKERPVFKSGNNTVSFAYTIPEYDKYVISKFQYKLEGFYEDWSSWSTKPDVTFENLPFGEYTFVLRAKIGNKLSKNTITFTFIIDRPWYVSVTAIVVYSFSFLILLLLMHRTYKRYYTKQKRKLVEENQKRLELKELESEREIMKLNNEKLTQDIESKNRELASSTINIIKKNEILSTIKKELKKSGMEGTGLSNVERIIDRNLNNKDDWKHFEEAFNNADKDFLKKLKSKHSDLTPHDLRFCTYLRLNLSSKEIAPLLNISVRSVEIKRYRLRKKLHLDHSESLVNYILEI